MLYAVHGPHSSSHRLTRLLRQALAGFFPAATALHPGILEYIDTVTRDAIGFDFLIHSSKMHIELHLADPETGKMHGFPFRKEDMDNMTWYTPEPPPDDERRPEITGADLFILLKTKPDLPLPAEATVDLVTQPLLRAFGEPSTVVIDPDTNPRLGNFMYHQREFPVRDYSECNMSVAARVTTSVKPRDVGTE